MTGFYMEITTTYAIDGDEDTIQLTCPAEYLRDGNARVIIYDEYGDDGDVTHTVMRVGGGQVAIGRTGAITLDLILRNGAAWRGEYRVMGQVIDIECHAMNISHHLTDEGGEIDLLYRVSLGDVLSTNRVVAKIRRSLE